jgi:hypothetical protein
MKNRKSIKAKVITDQNFRVEINPSLSFERDMMEFLNLERIAKEKGEDMTSFYLRQIFLFQLHQFYKDHEFIFTDDEKNFEVRACPNCTTKYVCKKTSQRVYCSALCKKNYSDKQIYLHHQLDYDKYCAYMKKNKPEEKIMSLRRFVQNLRKKGKSFWELT